ncbi:unnamed protein product [Orchesella dallaii]|uniref:Uncharacterized protein n=1 Tax=Orchesella dallaii TaxID=48710 RepID=A0ABP1QX89_9HEXA
MIDQSSFNFLAKLSLTCVVLSLAIIVHVDCRAVQNQQFGSAGELEAASSNQQPYQFQQHVYQHQPVAPNNFQYYEQQQQQQLQQHHEPQGVQYHALEQSISDSSSSSNKPNRRSILNSLMAPFYAMRDQGMAMLSASLQGCNPNTFSLWCRFWSMFTNK